MGDKSGNSVSLAGDINGDGMDDLIIGAYRANTGVAGVTGGAFVVFGRSDVLFASGFESE